MKVTTYYVKRFGHYSSSNGRYYTTTEFELLLTGRWKIVENQSGTKALYLEGTYLIDQDKKPMWKELPNTFLRKLFGFPPKKVITGYEDVMRTKTEWIEESDIKTTIEYDIQECG